MTELLPSDPRQLEQLADEIGRERATLDERTQAVAVALYRAKERERPGKPVNRSDIAKRLGVHRGTLTTWLKDAGIEPNQQPAWLTEAQKTMYDTENQEGEQ